MAASHKNLKKMVAEGAFREDLYYRLNTISLETTPLRDRPEDIEPLVAYFTEKICKENKFSKNFQRRCLDTFKKHHWKGNVRELRSAVENHLIRSDVSTIRLEDLDPVLFAAVVRENPKTLEEIDKQLDEQKRDLIADVLKRNTTQVGASKQLGISKNRLHYFIDKWGLG